MSRVLCRCICQCQSLLDLLSDREHWIARFSLSVPAKYLQRQHHARVIRGSNLVTISYGQGVRQGCPASGFLFAMAFDTIFRWLQEVVIPRNLDNLDFLRPTQCAYADDLAVASLSFRSIMTALAPAFRSVDYIAGFNLNYRKCCWVQHGTFAVLRDANCPIRQNCWNHDWPRWTHSSLVGTNKKFIQRVLKISASTKSLIDRLFVQIYAISVLSFIGSECTPHKTTLKAENHALQCTTAGPYHATPSNLLGVGSMWSWS